MSHGVDVIGAPYHHVHPLYQMSRVIERAILGIRRHRLRTGAEVGVTFAALWTALEPTQAFLQFQLGGWPRFVLLVLTSLLIGIWRAMPSDSKSVRIHGTNTLLTIAYEDLFAQEGVIAVPVNEFFDSSLGAHVSPKSVHGQTISKLFAGDSRTFDAAVDSALADRPAEVVSRSSGRQRRYAIGTGAYLSTGRPSVIAFAFTSTDLPTLKVSADVPQMWRALHGLWQEARIHVNERPLSIPLVGGGLSGVGLSPQQLLSLIVMSAVAETRRLRFGAHIRICLMEQQRSETDIDAALQLVS